MARSTPSRSASSAATSAAVTSFCNRASIRLRRLYNVSSRFAAAVGDCRAADRRDERVSSRNSFVLTKETRQPVRRRAAHEPFSLSTEFHACGAVPRVIRKALARFDTRHVSNFMLMTFMSMTFMSFAGPASSCALLPPTSCCPVRLSLSFVPIRYSASPSSI
jgi:hypothetical protein